MEVKGRSFSFLNGWFVGSMLIFLGPSVWFHRLAFGVSQDPVDLESIPGPEAGQALPKTLQPGFWLQEFFLVLV